MRKWTAMIGGVAVLASALWLFWIRDNEPQQNSSRPAPTSSVASTDEVLAAFEYLDDLRIRALEERDLGLLNDVFTSTSPARARVARTIQDLLANEVTVNEHRTVIDVGLVNRTSREARIQQVFEFDPEFVSDDGRDVTKGGGRERQEVIWVLRLQDGTWLIHDAEIVDAQPV